MARIPALAVLIGLMQPLSCWALSYVPISDQDLVRQATVVVLGEVETRQSAVDATGLYTDYSVRVLRQPKGEAISQLPIRVYGIGQLGQRAIRTNGAPDFAPGDRGLWFLSPRHDGTFGILHYALGAFRLTALPDGTEVLVRDLRSATALPLPGRPPVADGIRAATPFLEWIENDDLLDAPAYWLTEAAVLPRQRKFTLIESGSTGLNVRWFDFDTENGSVAWVANEQGYTSPAQGTGQGFAAFEAALAAWTQAESRVNLSYSGTTTTNTGGLDGENLIYWEDPADEISGSFSCATGGVLAIGGQIFSTATTEFDGTNYHPAIEGRVLTQDGAGCFFDGNAGLNGEEVFTHEIGHALGFGHSCGDSSSPNCVAQSDLDQAIMRASAHGDGRGGQIGQDDLAALDALYPAVEDLDLFSISRGGWRATLPRMPN